MKRSLIQRPESLNPIHQKQGVITDPPSSSHFYLEVGLSQELVHEVSNSPCKSSAVFVGVVQNLQWAAEAEGPSEQSREGFVGGTRHSSVTSLGEAVVRAMAKGPVGGGLSALHLGKVVIVDGKDVPGRDAIPAPFDDSQGGDAAGFTQDDRCC